MYHPEPPQEGTALLSECGEQRTSNSQLCYDLFQLKKTTSSEVETPWEFHTGSIRRLGCKCTVVLPQNKTTMTDNSCCIPPLAGLPCLCRTYLRLRLSSSAQSFFSSFSFSHKCWFLINTLYPELHRNVC